MSKMMSVAQIVRENEQAMESAAKRATRSKKTARAFRACPVFGEGANYGAQTHLPNTDPIARCSGITPPAPSSLRRCPDPSDGPGP